jgi:hypothetical protein
VILRLCFRPQPDPSARREKASRKQLLETSILPGSRDQSGTGWTAKCLLDYKKDPLLLEPRSRQYYVLVVSLRPSKDSIEVAAKKESRGAGLVGQTVQRHLRCRALSIEVSVGPFAKGHFGRAKSEKRQSMGTWLDLVEMGQSIE